MQTWHYWTLAALLLPLLAGGAVVYWYSPATQSGVDRARGRVDGTYAGLAESSRFWRRHILRWVLWPWTRLEGLTLSLEKPAWRAGALTAGYGYGLVFGLALVAALVYATVVVAIFLVMVAAAFWVLGAIFGGDNSSGRVTSQVGSARVSRERTDWLGDRYIEHVDANGQVVTRSRERRDVFGDTYTEHRDAAGNTVGTSRNRTDLFGDDYVEHQDPDNNVQGSSRRRKDFFGNDYVENRDENSRKTGESRASKDMFGDRQVKHRPTD